MKSIEEVVFERYLSDQKLPKHQRIGINNYIDWANLGAREAQRWIPVEEELPTISKNKPQVRVLVKSKIGGIYLSYFDRHGFSSHAKITHWRLLERY